MSKNTLFLIDGHSLCYRAFYAIKELRNSKGQATNAVFGFVRIVKNLIRDYNPEYMAVCFDSKEKTKREEKFKAYKIQRPKMPDDLISQIPIIKEVLGAFHIASFEYGGFEADDIIATITDKCSSQGIEIMIVTDDKDMYQCASTQVKFLSSKSEEPYDVQSLKEKLGFPPNRIVDFIALAGDSTDNIPGVVGVGKVTAQKLINQYSNLEDILKNVERIEPPALKEKIQSQKQSALMSKDLALLEKNVPVRFDLDMLKIKAPDQNRLFEIFKELEFRTLAQEYAQDGPALKKTDVVLLDKPADIKKAVNEVTQKGCFAFLIEGDQDSEAQLFHSLFIASSEGKVYQLSEQDIAQWAGVFEDRNIKKVTHNLKYALKYLSKKGIHVHGDVFDCLLAGFLLSPTQSSININDLVWNHLKISLPQENASAYQAGHLLNLSDKLEHELKEKVLYGLYADIELPLSYVLSDMELHGVGLDVDLLRKLSKECELKINALTKQLYAQAGEEFNLNSPKQLAHVLFEKLKLPAVKKTKTGLSTNEEVLTKLALKHPFPALILEYRQLAKLKSTYIDALPQLVDAQTGRLHAEFNQTGAETGRLSSKNPNLQNIPIRTELGREIRKAIIPSEKGLSLLAADYSQVELRILAHLSKDQQLKSVFLADGDVHRSTAALIHDVDEKDVTQEMRYAAKRINFGIIYGMSAFGLAKDLNISQNDAQEFIDRYFATYPGVKQFMDECIAKCEKDGYVLTLLNRRRYIAEINSPNMALRQFAQRQAINTPVQGSAADLIKLAMITIDHEIKKEKLKSRMLITVHDELVFETSKDEQKKLSTIVREHMEHPVELDVPIKVDMKLGPNWLDMKVI